MTDDHRGFVLDRLEEGFLLLGGDGTVADANRSARELLGLDEGSVGASLAELSPGLLDVTDRLAPGETETVDVGSDTRSVSVEVLDPVFTDRRLVLLREATDRGPRMPERHRHEALLGLMPDAVVVTDTDGYLVEIHGFEGWSGYEEEELLGEHVSVAMTDEDVERAGEVVGRLIRGDGRETATYEAGVVTKDGTVVPHEFHVTLLPPGEDGRVPGSMSVLRNIAERKEQEEELERKNERLDEFASVVSHDLRSPLNVIAGRLELARETGDPEEFEAMTEAVDRMEALLRELLALARAGEAVGETTAVPLAELARAAWRTTDRSDATLEVVDDPVVEANETRLQQLFENLFSNAVTHAGTDVAVRVGRGGGGFFVEDDGPGIPVEERDAVYDWGTSGSPTGTGYGLAIVEEIAEAHGWSVDVVGGVDGGARFEFSGVGFVA